MPNIQLETGNTIYVSTYEYYFVLTDDKIAEFFQSCVADNLGVYVDDPFSNRTVHTRLEQEEVLDVDEIPSEE